MLYLFHSNSKTLVLQYMYIAIIVHRPTFVIQITETNTSVRSSIKVLDIKARLLIYLNIGLYIIIN